MYLGIDIGASYCKVALANAAGKVMLYETLKMPPFTSSSTQRPLFLEVDIGKITDVVFGLIKRATVEVGQDIEAIYAAGQMHGIVLVGKSGNPLSDFISWQDRRTNELIPSSNISYIDYLREGLARYRLATGTDIRPGMMGPLLFWWRHKGEMNLSNARAAFLADYFVSLLTDAEITCDPAQAAGSGVYDILEHDWIEEYFTITGVSRDVLPCVVPSGTRMGGVSSPMARVLGLRQGIPVYVATGDYQAAIFAAEIDDRSVSINIGSGAQFSIIPEEPGYSVSYETRPFFDGFCLNCVSGLSGGRAISLFEDFCTDIFHRFSEPPYPLEILHKLDEICMKRSGKTSMSCNPRFFDDGGSFSAISHRNFRLEDCYDALLDGLVLEYHDAYRTLNASHNLPQDMNIVLSGGVARKSALIRRKIRETFGYKAALSKYREEAAAGAALLARKYNSGR